MKRQASSAVENTLFFVWQLDLYFQYVQIAVSLQIYFDVVGIDIDVFGNHGDQVALQGGKVIGLVAVTA